MNAIAVLQGRCHLDARSEDRPVPLADQLRGSTRREIHVMATLYSTKVTATGGRHGSIRSDDGLLDLKLALARALGGEGDATNPQQLFVVAAR